jgi:hypothetical protein
MRFKKLIAAVFSLAIVLALATGALAQVQPGPLADT